MLREDRERSGFTVDEIAWRLGASQREYRELEAGRRLPEFRTSDRMRKLYGWPQRFETEADSRSAGYRR
jgi:hypothetical protein